MVFQGFKQWFSAVVWLAGSLFLFSGCEVEDPDFSNVRDIKMLGMDGRKLEMEFTVDCENPNAFGFKVKPSKLDVSVDDEILGEIHLDKKIKVKRKSNNSYTVPVTIELADGAMFRLIKYVSREKVDVKLEGKVRGSVYGITKSFQVKETRSIDGSLFKLEM